MDNNEFISVIVTMLSQADSGRIQPLSKDAFNGNYRPHIVIGDPNQRKAVIIEKDGFKNYIDEFYQGISFWKGPEFETVPVNEQFEAIFKLMYYPEHKYENVIPNATFTIREGPKIIGFGKVLNRRHEG